MSVCGRQIQLALALTLLGFEAALEECWHTHTCWQTVTADPGYSHQLLSQTPQHPTPLLRPPLFLSLSVFFFDPSKLIQIFVCTNCPLGGTKTCRDYASVRKAQIIFHHLWRVINSVLNSITLALCGSICSGLKGVVSDHSKRGRD